MQIFHRKLQPEEFFSDEEEQMSCVEEKFEELDEYNGDHQPFQKDFFQISELMKNYTDKDIESFK